MNADPSNEATEVFKKLGSLAGRWREVNSTIHVEYREAAQGSILVEDWSWPESGIEALTIYFLDVDQLLATHYCPAGNQPTLRFTPTSNQCRYEFRFASATNLPDERTDHCKSFWIELIGTDKFLRSETYVERGVIDTKTSTYERLW